MEKPLKSPVGPAIDKGSTQQMRRDRIHDGLLLAKILKKRSKLVANGCDMMVDKWVPNKHAFVKLNRIGSDSHFGEAYKVANYDDPATPMFLAVKVLPDTADAANELAMYKRFTSAVLTGVSPHFPIILSTVKCDECRYENQELFDNGPVPKECRYVFNELASGDLRTWSHTVHQPMEYYSMLAQVLLGLGFMHSKGYSHNDVHWGNVLHHAVPARGFWHYRVVAAKRTHDVYVRNTGQQWVWWDFGFMAKTTENVNHDLLKICESYEWAENDLNVPYPARVKAIMRRISATATKMTDIAKSDVAPLLLGMFPLSTVVVHAAGQPVPKGVLNAQPFTLTV